MSMIHATNNHLLAVLEYILESEADDFEENPSDNHVYYHAYALKYGVRLANKILEQALRENE